MIGVIIGDFLLLVPGLLIWIYGIYNAYKVAKKINLREIPYKETSNDLMLFMIISIAILFVIGLLIIAASIIATFVFGMMKSV